MAFSKNASLPIAAYVVASTDVTTAAEGLVQTFTVSGVLTSDRVIAQVIGTGSSLSSAIKGSRVSATNTVELTLETAVELNVYVQVWRSV